VRLGYNQEDYWRSISGTYTHGKFEDVLYDEVSVSKPFRVGSRFTATVKANHRWENPKGYDDNGYPEEDRTIWLWRWVSEYSFAWDARTKLTVEETNQDRHNLTWLFSWYPGEKTDFHIAESQSG